MKNMKKNDIEVLSPAGSYQALKAVINAGADAVYAAGDKFGARAYADNLTKEELCEAIDYVHLHKKRLYLTVNTLLKETELETQLYDYILPLYEQGLDAVIVQDFGVLSFIKQEFPNLNIHASTQMNITSKYGALFLQKLGVSRVVTARELSLEEIKDIHTNSDIEIESFVHGALCYSYSGQCLFSSILGGRSGNRGRCAQPCRLPYSVNGKKASYLMSLKDISAIEILPKLIESGICSLKIEGRMKQAEYGAGVTSIYRKYVDLYQTYGAKGFSVSEKDRSMLLDFGNRSGFTKGYYEMYHGADMITGKQSAHAKGNSQLQENIRETYLQKEIKEKINGTLILSKELPAKIILNYEDKSVECTGSVVEQAMQRPLDEKTVSAKMKKTGNTPFEFLDLTLHMDPDIFYSMSELNQLRRNALTQLEQNILSETRRQVTQKTSETKSERKQNSFTHPSLSVSVMKKEQFYQLLNCSFIQSIYLDYSAFLQERMVDELSKLTSLAEKSGKKIYLGMPPVFRKKDCIWFEKNIDKLEHTGITGFFVKNFDEIMFLKTCSKSKMKIVSDSQIYAYNNKAVTTTLQSGVDRLTVPLELNKKELQQMNDSDSEFVIYGYIPLMISAQCIKKTLGRCDHKKEFLKMDDRYGKQFIVQNVCGSCYNIIYNSTPLSLFHHAEVLRKMKLSNYRIHFIDESEQEIQAILSFYEESIIKMKQLKPNMYLSQYTNGHFKRGVE